VSEPTAVSAGKVSDEVPGTGVPHGNAVTKPGPAADTAVRLATTATALAGMPGMRWIGQLDHLTRAETAGVEDEVGCRVSSSRCGESAVYESAARRREEARHVDDHVGLDVGEQAELSPAERDTTVLVTTAPAAKLMLLVGGMGVPHGYAVTKPAAGPAMAVTLATTPTASAGARTSMGARDVGGQRDVRAGVEHPHRTRRARGPRPMGEKAP
jgi:hypothetical protein